LEEGARSQTFYGVGAKPSPTLVFHSNVRASSEESDGRTPTPSRKALCLYVVFRRILGHAAKDLSGTMNVTSTAVLDMVCPL
jgi:hypothetical protein